MTISAIWEPMTSGRFHPLWLALGPFLARVR